MSDNIITVQNLSKVYRLFHQRSGPRDGLRHVLNDAFTAPYRWLTRKPATPESASASARRSEEFWALKDLSFEIKRGEVVGVIGRNGAGKSTLLKILSRITEPTSGRVEINGRVASLLEVGTGFHPELTGRENVFLNGAILGMSKSEIRSKFDEIVAFAEVEKFLDTPVKRYSSGMYVRLAFAVAAHLEPEVLIVDEVLAVGDAEFQKKCLGKMGQVAQSGRTVLFVSHNMAAVERLCPKAIFLKAGKLQMVGDSRRLIRAYVEGLQEQSKTFGADRSGSGQLQFQSIELRTSTGAVTSRPISGEPLNIHLSFKTYSPLNDVAFYMTIYNQNGVAVTHFASEPFGKGGKSEIGSGEKVCVIPKLPLPIGHYHIAVAAAAEGRQLDAIPAACTFDVETSLFLPGGYSPSMQYCAAMVEHQWK